MSEDVTTLHRSQKRLASRVLASAFLADPLYSDLFPDIGRREHALQSMFSGLLTYALRYGVSHTTSDVAGVAIWLGPGNARLTLWRTLRTGMALPRALMSFGRPAREPARPAAAPKDPTRGPAAEENPYNAENYTDNADLAFAYQ